MKPSITMMTLAGLAMTMTALAGCASSQPANQASCADNSWKSSDCKDIQNRNLAQQLQQMNVQLQRQLSNQTEVATENLQTIERLQNESAELQSRLYALNIGTIGRLQNRTDALEAQRQVLVAQNLNLSYQNGLLKGTLGPHGELKAQSADLMAKNSALSIENAVLKSEARPIDRTPPPPEMFQTPDQTLVLENMNLAVANAVLRDDNARLQQEESTLAGDKAVLTGKVAQLVADKTALADSLSVVLASSKPVDCRMAPVPTWYTTSHILPNETVNAGEWSQAYLTRPNGNDTDRVLVNACESYLVCYMNDANETRLWYYSSCSVRPAVIQSDTGSQWDQVWSGYNTYFRILPITIGTRVAVAQATYEYNRGEMG